MTTIQKTLEAEIRRAEVRGVLTYLAHQKQFIEYVHLASTFGMFSGGSELSRILSEIQTEDHEAERGMLSSLVIGGATRTPGRGYFEHARQKLKRQIPYDPSGELEFWHSELSKLGMAPPVGDNVDEDEESLSPAEQVRRALVRRLPSIMGLFNENDFDRLVEAWESGVSRATKHPAIEIIFGEQLSQELLSVLDVGLARVDLQGQDLRPIVDRFVNERDFGLARGAANELWTAAHLAAAGGLVSLEDSSAPGKKPEFTVEYEGEKLSVEVVGISVAHQNEKRNNQLTHLFHKWPRRKKMPKDLRGHASDGNVRMLETGVSVLREGSLVDKIEKLSDLKDSSQLRGRPCPILVISARHQWGFFGSDCAPYRLIKGAKYTGIGFAAVYGRAGDYVFDGEEFDGRGYEMKTQKHDGILRKSKTIAAVVFIFQNGRSVVFENLQKDCGFPSRLLAHYVRRAFDADPELSIFKAH